MTPRAFVVTAFGFGAAAALAAACSSASNNAGTPSTTVYNTPSSDASDAGAEPAVSADASTGAASVIQGSPLCNASRAGGICYPDDPASAMACGLAPDGGAYDPSAASAYEGGVLGCHVVNEGGVPVSPATGCFVPGAGTDGAGCEASTGCGATEECVATGTCRPYCCSGACGAQDFCDIQPETQNPALVVPVCMPVQPCTLLEPSDAGGCPQLQTCSAFVGEAGVGMTTCVDVGPGRAGDDCDSQHCAAGLICIGVWGAKRCYALCQTDAGAACGPSQTCAGGLPLFPSPGVGVCQQAVGPDF